MSEENAKIKIATELLNLYQTQYSQTDKIWNYFSTTSLGLIVLIIGGKSLVINEWHLGVVIVGYVIFCLGNYQSLIKAQKQLSEFATKASTATKEAGIPFQTLEPFSNNSITQFYRSVVVAVIVGMVVIYSF